MPFCFLTGFELSSPDAVLTAAAALFDLVDLEALVSDLPEAVFSDLLADDAERTDAAAEDLAAEDVPVVFEVPSLYLAASAREVPATLSAS